MIKDVEFAFFAQLSYLNWNKINIEKLKNEVSYQNKKFLDFLKLKEQVWNKIRIDNLEPKLKNGILMYDENDKRIFGTFGIEKDGDNIKPLYDFNGWQFIYSADKTKLFKARYNVDVKDDGFYACAFMKDNDIVVAYRGTEPNTFEDLITDLEIGFLNHNHSQLICAYMFLEHIKEKNPGKNIHITGHSLGGCLAQYACVCSKKEYPVVTWNALGLGKHKHNITENLFWGNDITKYLEIYSAKVKKGIEKKFLWGKEQTVSDEFTYLSEREIIVKIIGILDPKTKEIVEEKYFEVKSFDSPFFKVSFGFQESALNRERNHLSNSQKESLEKSVSLSAIHIYWLLRGIKNYKSSLSKGSSNIKNYYNHYDWTALIKTREGICIDVLTGDTLLEEPVDDSKWRVITETVKKLKENKKLFAYHSVNDFIMYMDETGNIHAGILNKTFSENLYKTALLNLKENYKEDICGKEILTDADKFFNNFKKNTVHKNNFTAVNSEVDIEAEIDKITAAVDLNKKKRISKEISKITKDIEAGWLSSTAIDKIEGDLRYKKLYKKTIKDLSKLYKYSKIEEANRPAGSNINGIYEVGILSNIDVLAGIIGGNPLILYTTEKKSKEDQVEEKAADIEEDYSLYEENSGGKFRFNGRGEAC